MKYVIHSAEDHTPALIAMGVGQHKFKKCPVAEKSDVDAAEKSAKDFAGGLTGQLREELTRVVAELGRKVESRINQLGEAKTDLVKLQELACSVKELDAKLELAEKGSMKTIRLDLEALESRVKEIMEQLPKQSPGPDPNPPSLPDGNNHEELEIGLKKVELNLADAVERISQLEQRPVVSTETEPSSSFWRRLRWLLRGV